MRYLFAIFLAAASLALADRAASAQTLYSFETLYNSTGNPDPSGTRPDGFIFNGPGTTIARSTIGTTDGAFSLRFTQLAPVTFTGAITTVLRPELDDPAVYALVCDVTVPETGAFAGGFARLGITMFGNNEEQGAMGQPAQTTSEAEANIELAPGTHHVTVPLIARGNPITFDLNVPFHTIFGPDTSTQMTPSSFQYYINKSNDSALTVYIDNVHVAKTGDIDGNGTINGDDFALIDRGITRTYAPDSPPGWINGDLNTDGFVNAADYAILNAAYAQQQFPPAGPGGIGAVPEPAAVAGVAFVLVAARRRRGARG